MTSFVIGLYKLPFQTTARNVKSRAERELGVKLADSDANKIALILATAFQNLSSTVLDDFEEIKSILEGSGARED